MRRRRYRVFTVQGGVGQGYACGVGPMDEFSKFIGKHLVFGEGVVGKGLREQVGSGLTLCHGSW